jgi:hypothetical protein
MGKLESSPERARVATTEPSQEKGDQKARTVSAEPGYPKTVETRSADETPTDDPPRAVSLPREAPPESIAASIIAREKPLVAVAFVRGGKLVRRAELLRALAREVGKDTDLGATVVALARLDPAAKDPAALEDLERTAETQGVDYLVLEAREDDASPPSLEVVFHPGTRSVLRAHARPEVHAGADPSVRLAEFVLKAVRFR